MGLFGQKKNISNGKDHLSTLSQGAEKESSQDQAEQLLIKTKAFEVLSTIMDPVSQKSIVEQSMIASLNIYQKPSDKTKGAKTAFSHEIGIMIEVDPKQGAALEELRQEVEKKLSAIESVTKVTAGLTAHKGFDQSKPQVKGDGSKQQNEKQTDKELLPLVKNVVVVSSGKGGVGKSTICANLAVSLAAQGHKVGLMDADIYGPSQPRMMGLSGQRPQGEEGDIEPLHSQGVKVMSIGFMVSERAPLVWRGPMVQSALIQLARDVNWGELDVLFIDMPPGTGDAQLTIAQKFPITGAVIVSTPQDIALIDARKGIEMFKKVNIPILGIIENMSTFICPKCSHEEHIFGQDGAKKEAQDLGVPFLGEIPLTRDIRLQADAGKLSVGEHKEIFKAITTKIYEAL